MGNTRVGSSVIWIAIAAVLVGAWYGGAVLAQRGAVGPGQPGPMPPMQGPPIMMKAGSAGVFVLTGNVLTKYDSALAQNGSIKLEVPKQQSDDVQRPMGPPPTHMLLSSGANEKVIVLIGDQFFSVDAASFKIAAKAKLPAVKLPTPPDNAPVPPQDGPAPGMPPMMGPPMGQAMPVGLELRGDVLYMLRGPQIIGININDGKIVGPAELPKPQPPSE